MKLIEGELEFDFTNALEAFKFDVSDSQHPHFHGLSHCMKAVDFIAEYPAYYLFVEIKDPPLGIAHTPYSNEKEMDFLTDSLAKKFLDSLIYRWCECKLEKPIRYYCFVNVRDHAMVSVITDKLKKKMPVRPIKKAPTRWKRQLVSVISVMNEENWNKNFPDIPVKRLS